MYALHGRVFVRSRMGDEEVREIAGVKRRVGLVGLVGIALIGTSLFTSKVAGLTILGMDEEKAVSSRLDELDEVEETKVLGEVADALDESDSFAYALDTSSWQLLVDILAKLLLATAVFADFLLRSTVAAWRNDRAMRARPEAIAYDASAEALAGAVGS